MNVSKLFCKRRRGDLLPSNSVVEYSTNAIDVAELDKENKEAHFETLNGF